MTKAEIIRKLAKKVGVQDIDAKIFFEVFLRKVALQLSPGETIKINNLGYFQIRTGISNRKLVSKSDQITPDLIVFFPLQNEKSRIGESLIFNVPDKNEEGFNLIDSYFSLSFGKAVIPLEGANVSEYFVPPTGNELRRLFDTKADKLLREVEVIENYQNEDEIKINSEQINPNLETQIKEEGLIDTENELNQFLEDIEMKELTWNFGESLENIDKEKKIENDRPEKNTPQPIDEKKLPDDFQRVNPLPPDFNIVPDNSIDKGSEFDMGFDQVTNADTDILKSINEGKKDEDLAGNKYQPQKKEFDNFLKTSREINKRIGGSPPYSKQKGMGLFVILASLIILGGAVFLYLKFINVNYIDRKQPVNIDITRSTIQPVIIERDYDIPVTYPYTRDSGVIPAIDPVNKSVFTPIKYEDSKVTGPIDQDNQNKQTNLTSENNKLNPVSAIVKNKDFVFQSGDKFIVQISSWSTERSALKHAAYFKDKGFQTEIAKTPLDRGTWYRVRIGYFNSEKEAVSFYNKYR